MGKTKIVLISTLIIIAMAVSAYGAFYHTLEEVHTTDGGTSMDSNADGVIDVLPVETDITAGGDITAAGIICDGNSCLGDVISYWTQVGQDIYYNQGNVGIGTSTPISRLDVVGDVQASGTICDSTGCISAPDTDWVEENGNIYRETGNVGIGTNNPLRTFQVLGDASIGQYANLGEDVFPDEWNGAQEQEEDTCDGNNVAQFTVCESDREEVCSDVWFNATEWLKRDVTCIAAIAGLTNDAAGVVIQGRNVGIGTTNPSKDLEVIGEVKVSGAGNGIESSGSNYGLYAKDADQSGYGYVGKGDGGIEGYGNSYGVYGKDEDNSGYGYIGNGDVGIRGYGNSYGVYGEDLTSGSFAKLGLPTRGLEARSGSQAAGNMGAYIFLKDGDLAFAQLARRTSSDVYYGLLTKIRHTDGSAGVYAYMKDGNDLTRAYFKGAYRDGSNYYGLYGRSTYGANGWGLYCYGDKCGGNKAWTTTSDARKKQNIQTIINPLEKIQMLRGVTFEWKENPSQKAMGFIAQEAIKAVPEVVSKDGEGFYTMQSSQITALLAEGIKAQQDQIDELITENQKLKDLVCLDHPEAKICN